MIPSSIFQLQEKSSFFYGHNFYKMVMSTLANELNVDFILVGKLTNKKREVQSIVYDKASDKFLPLNYDLRATPCEIVSERSYCTYEKEVAKLFPEDYLLTEMNIEGYVGVAFSTPNSNEKGLLVALTHNEIISTEIIGGSLKMFESRFANELEREGVKILNPDNYQ